MRAEEPLMHAHARDLKLPCYCVHCARAYAAPLRVRLSADSIASIASTRNANQLATAGASR